MIPHERNYSMNKSIALLVGLVCLVVGGLLVYWGHSQAQSLAGQFNSMVNGSPSDNTMWLYIGGAVLLVVGLFLSLTGVSRR